MLSLLFSNPIAFLILFPGLIAAITIHEFAHAWTADKLGDPTPRYQGRVTLNPLAHLDPLGTLLMLITRFGWGKPVQFDPHNLAHPLRDTALIALAGPASNLVFATILAALVRFEVVGTGLFAAALAQVLVINVVLAIFNLIPVHPLDGSKIIVAVLPKRTAFEYEEFMSKYGLIVLLMLLFPWTGQSAATQLIWPPISFIVNLLLGL